MFVEWLYPLADHFALFNVFQYITFRSGGALLTAFLITFLSGPIVIAWLKAKQGEGQPIRTDGPESHLLKQGTPTMGGMMMLLGIVPAVVLWVDWHNGFVWAVLTVTIGYGAIGFFDDYLKLTRRHSKGLNAKLKLCGQIIFGIIVTLWIMDLQTAELSDGLAIPFLKEFLLDLGWFFIPFALCVMVGASNAVNLTDGLDGLAIGPIMLCAACFALIAYLSGNVIFANYLQIHYVPGSGELAVFCATLIGSGLGFLWYNAPPARIFMGDTGSLAIGGALGAVALVTKHELVLAIIGGLFVLETISVIVQVASFKMRGKRVFLMAPLHHHFEKKGWPETTVVMRFWILAVIFALIGLSTLKLR